MIRILLLDDDSTKVGQVKTLLLQNPDLREDNVFVASDIVSAAKLLQSEQFDLLILDILLPYRFGDMPSKTGGFDFLREIVADDSYSLPFHIIGLTEYESIQKELYEYFSDFMWQLVHYNPLVDSWRLRLSNYINYLVRSKKELSSPSNLVYDYDLAIVTALHEVELDNVLKLNAHWKEFSFPNDYTVYHKGIFESDTKRLRVVAASASQMGLTAMSLVTNKIIINFRPRYIVICGIAAGVKGKGNYGDILISDLSWDYGSGKIATDVNGEHTFLQDPRPISLAPEILSIVQLEAIKRSFINEIEDKWRKGHGAPIPHRLNIRTGPFASGSYVIANLQKVQEVVDQNRKLIGIDMETYAVFYTAQNISHPRPIPLSMKSVCDYGDSDKKDDFQNYAGFTSANYLYHFSLKFL